MKMRQPDLQNKTMSPSHDGRAPIPGPVSQQRSSRRLRTGAIIVLIVLLALVFGVGLFAGWTFAVSGGTGTGTLQIKTNTGASIPPLTGSNIEAVRAAVVAKVRPAVVQINVVTASGQGLGSGVIIDQRGYIVTNHHVVDGAQHLEVVLYDGTELPAQLIGTDPADDLAVVKVTPPKTGLTVATLGDSSKVRVGQEVLAIGNPLGITQTVTSGIISALGRTVSEGSNGATIPDAIQTDAPINPGNSGGALVDLQGNVRAEPSCRLRNILLYWLNNGTAEATNAGRSREYADIYYTGFSRNTRIFRH